MILLPPSRFLLSRPLSLHYLLLDREDERCCSCTPARCWFWLEFLPLWCHVRLLCNYNALGQLYPPSLSRTRAKLFREHCFQVWNSMRVKCFFEPLWHRAGCFSVLRPDLNQTEGNMDCCSSFVNTTVVFWKDERVQVCFLNKRLWNDSGKSPECSANNVLVWPVDDVFMAGRTHLGKYS